MYQAKRKTQKSTSCQKYQLTVRFFYPMTATKMTAIASCTTSFCLCKPFKDLFTLRGQSNGPSAKGAFPRLADAKVRTFFTPAKYFRNFFSK
jgi:hypothetical protein